MRFKSAAGFSIVEFLIATSLGALLIAIAGAVYLSNKTTYRIQDGLARLQENGRYAAYILAKDLRMAGFQGCANQRQVKVTNLVTNPSIVLNYDTPLLGFDGLSSTFSPALPANITGKAVTGNDVVEIRMASNRGVQLREDMNRTNNPILVYDRLDIQAGMPIMITNCVIGDIFIAGANSNATAITHTVTNNNANDLSIPYLHTAQIMQLLYYAYYIKNTGRVNAQGQPVYALMRQDINGNEIELAEGVERMRITYGVDTNTDNVVDSYQTATQINAANNWNNVISIRINLLLATVENVNNKIQPYVYNGSTVTPTDRKLRRQWEVFVTLRNRGLST
ncbi:PilW family protein [Legionella dresdenensis]|uniref:PilW family protein n=1 Tax=Legionella dresdenensis TaxID=450200 RepID=A0ABV8CD50_9GAMM